MEERRKSSKAIGAIQGEINERGGRGELLLVEQKLIRKDTTDGF